MSGGIGIGMPIAWRDNEMKYSSVIEGLTDKTLSMISRCGRVFPVRCQLCGSWGIPNVGRKWICDACYAKLFTQERDDRIQNGLAIHAFQHRQMQTRLPL